jgi:hypothetical protein
MFSIVMCKVPSISDLFLHLPVCSFQSTSACAFSAECTVPRRNDAGRYKSENVFVNISVYTNGENCSHISELATADYNSFWSLFEII